MPCAGADRTENGAQGQANKQIAAEFGLAEIIVKDHVSRILKKLVALDHTRSVAQQPGWHHAIHVDVRED
ncbi:MAG: LuxR C-terminal-related transcriptional regulator [Gimesia chilikensis]|uniref:LuxR C-terminal-related transcriptional regulator n=1 Tax=Gimesia chilikensis TaxID=2605989 RepID=UPI0037880EC7